MLPFINPCQTRPILGTQGRIVAWGIAISSGILGIYMSNPSPPGHQRTSETPVVFLALVKQFSLNHGSGMSLEDDVVILVCRQDISRAVVLVIWPSSLLLCLGLLLGLHLGIGSGRVSLLLSSNLLQAVELFSVQLVELRVDV
jgi:hypothetical protein